MISFVRIRPTFQRWQDFLVGLRFHFCPPPFSGAKSKAQTVIKRVQVDVVDCFVVIYNSKMPSESCETRSRPRWQIETGSWAGSTEQACWQNYANNSLITVDPEDEWKLGTGGWKKRRVLTELYKLRTTKYSFISLEKTNGWKTGECWQNYEPRVGQAAICECWQLYVNSTSPNTVWKWSFCSLIPEQWRSAEQNKFDSVQRSLVSTVRDSTRQIRHDLIWLGWQKRWVTREFGHNCDCDCAKRSKAAQLS